MHNGFPSARQQLGAALLPVSALYSFPKIQTGSEVSGKSSNSPKRSVSYVKVAVGGGGTRRLQAVSVSERTGEGTVVVVLAAAKPPVAADYSEALMCFARKGCSILVWRDTKQGR